MHIFLSVFMQAWQEEIGPRHDKEKAVDEIEEKQYPLGILFSRVARQGKEYKNKGSLEW